MSRYLFDVGVLALAHAHTPHSEPALEWIEDAIYGEIDAVVPHTAMIGAHHVLRNVYRIGSEAASRRLSNLLDARRIEWYSDVDETAVRAAFDLAGSTTVEAWDGYYATVARETGATTVVGLDDDFDALDDLDAELVLSPESARKLHEYISSL